MMAGGMAPPPQAHHIAPISENHHLGAPAPLPPGVSPAPGQLPPGVTADHAEVGEYIFDRLRDCDVDPTAPPHDCLHDFAFEVTIFECLMNEMG